MSGRENGYVGPDRRLRAPIMGITHTQLALKRLNCLENEGEGREVSLTKGMVGWGGRIRTCECRYQKPVPYHLATPHQGMAGP